MTQIVIAGASTFGVKNAGDDAMLSNMVEGFRRSIPECRLIFLARHPGEEYDKVFGISSIKNIEHDSKEQSMGRWFRGFNPGDPTDHLGAIRRAIEGCDLVVIGGNSFMEVSQADFLRGVSSYAALLATFARFCEKPYALYGVAAHPLKQDYTKQIARFLCNNAALVTVREEFSRQQLLAAGADGRNIHVLADPAFGLDPIWDQDRARRLLRSEGIDLSSRPVVGIAFRHMYWSWQADDTDRFAAKMAQLCDAILEDVGAQLVFIPNATYDVDTPFEDDRVIARMVKERMGHQEGVHLISGDYYLPDTLSLFQLLDMLVSNRRHSCVFAALHGVAPLLMSTGHDWHFRPLADALGMPQQVVSLTEDSLDSLRSKVAETWAGRVLLASQLAQNVPQLRAKAHQHVDLLVDLIRRRAA